MNLESRARCIDTDTHTHTQHAKNRSLFFKKYSHWRLLWARQLCLTLSVSEETQQLSLLHDFHIYRRSTEFGIIFELFMAWIFVLRENSNKYVKASIMHTLMNKKLTMVLLRFYVYISTCSRYDSTYFETAYRIVLSVVHGLGLNVMDKPNLAVQDMPNIIST